MYKGYRNRLTNKGVKALDHMNKCTKCHKLNPSLHPSAVNNVQHCLFCGNPFYLIRVP